MSNYGLELIELTGRWVGFYKHRWEQLGTFPIIAELSQTGSRITGEMFDQITDRSQYLDTLLKVCGDDISAHVRQNWVSVIKSFGTEVIRSSRLPETSSINGKIVGREVTFTKAYRGPYDISWSVGECEIGSKRLHGHKVHYKGHVDPERMCLTGEWTIRHPGLLSWVFPPRAWGTFELYKKP
jgi:hypothetical protein